jgi:integrase
MWQLTDETLTQCVLPEGKSEKLYFDRDLTGFGIRVRRKANGRILRKWFFQYRSKLDGKQHRVALGQVDKPAPVSAAKAREAAIRLSERVQTGTDPQKERKEAKKAHKLLLLDAALKYLDDRRNGIVGKRPMRDSTYGPAKRYFELHWAALARRPVASITEGEVKTELRRIIERHGKQAARAAKSNLSAFFVWALKEGIAKSNPTIHTHELEQNNPRDRVFGDDEIRAIWAALRDDDFGRIVKLLFYTACRRDEIGGLRWSEINLDTGIMTLSSARTKSGRGLLLTLPAQAIEVLRQCPHKAGREFLFGQAGGAFSRWSWEKMAIEKRMAETGDALKPWGLHDIRRTVRTRLGKIGIKPHVAELALGHAAHKIGIVGTYDHHDYADEIRDALARWANALTAIISPPDKTNVTPIRATA